MSQQQAIPATYMRGGTSKGVFFKRDDLPPTAQTAGQARDQLLLRVIGSPDPYGKHIDGMGGATSSTSKTVIISKSEQGGHDVDYLFGQVSIDQPMIDWSGNCGNLSAAVAPFAIRNGLVDAAKIPDNGIATITIWQVNTQKTLIAHVTMCHGHVKEIGEVMLDGVAFPAAAIPIEFIDPVDNDRTLFPTGNVVDSLHVPAIGTFNATMISAGIPTLFLNANELGYQGSERQEHINNDAEALARFETIRAYGALKMGLIDDIQSATTQQHIPKIAFCSPPQDYTASNGKRINAERIDLCVRALSMGKLHHAMMGTAAVAIAAAAAVPDTLINLAAGGGQPQRICFGHPSGTLTVGAITQKEKGQWRIKKVTMERSARMLMQGEIYIP